MDKNICITISNIKGGVGKTLTTINLAGEMERQGKKVLLLDNDCQSNLTQILNIKSEYTMEDVYINKKINFNDAIVKYSDNIDIIPNTIASAELEYVLHNRMTRELILLEKSEELTNEYDYILIDNSPFLGITTTNAFVLSDYVLVIADESTSSIEGLKMVDNLIEKVKKHKLNTNIKLLGILRNNFEKRSNFVREFNDVIEKQLEGKLFETIIYNSIKYKEATTLHQTIQAYSRIYSEPYSALYSEIIRRIE